MVNEIIKDVWRSRIKVPSDLIQSLRGTETHTRNDYLGRVIFELFQNAVDRADRRIDIALEGVPGADNYRLVVANDGKPVSIRAMDGAPPDKCRSDFQALCNIHNSYKTAGQSIGNKGVGFKSAWEFASQITVASTLDDGGRYGFRFYQVLTAEQVLDRESFWPDLDANLRRDAANVLEKVNGLPSFYFPEYVADVHKYFVGREDWAKTIIVLEGIKESSPGKIQALIAEFSNAPLIFVNQLRDEEGKKPQRNIHVNTHKRLISDLDGWTVVDETLLGETWLERLPLLHEDAAALNFTIAQPSLAIAFPPESADGWVENRPNKFFCYLPTYEDCGFGVNVHADFMLDMSRKHVDAANPYNKSLLCLAGQLLGRALKTRADLHCRADVMGFLVPGKAENPAAKELRRGLALELHLPLQDEQCADPATLRKFLTDVFSSRPIWPEVRYVQTLMFLRHWCAKWYYERKEDYSRRTQDFINLFRVANICFLPERVADSVINPLALPAVQETGRSQDGQGIFWRRPRKNESDKEPSNDDTSLAATGIKGLAVTEWDKLEDADKDLLGLAVYDLGTLASRLRINLEERFPDEGVVQIELTDGFNPDAVLSFFAAMLTRSTQSYLDGKMELKFLSEPRKTADDLSRMLLPVAGGGWRRGREVFLPEAEQDVRFLGADWPVASMLDSARFQAYSGLDGAEQQRQLALALGAWPCMPLRQNGDTWGLPFDLASLNIRTQAVDFYQALIRAWKYWSIAAPEIARVVARSLASSDTRWLPLNIERNLPQNAFGRPREVLLVRDGDNARQVFLQKMVASNDDEKEALNAIDVVGLADASPRKLLALLAFMRGSAPTDEGLRGRYRTMILELSRKWSVPPDDLAMLKDLPLLVSEDNIRTWKALSQAGSLWFVPREFQYLRRQFAEQCVFLDFDVQTKAEWVRDAIGARFFTPVLEPKSGDPECSNKTTPQPCQSTRDLFQREHFANLILIAESASVGGQTRSREDVVNAWGKLIFRRGDRVWLKVFLDGQEQRIGDDLNHKDVLLYEVEPYLEIWHDLEPNDFGEKLHLFAEPMASGVFGNRSLVDAFAAYLGAGDRRKSWLDERYGLSPDDQEAMQAYLDSQLLSNEQLNPLMKALSALAGMNLVDKETLRARWWDPYLYTERRVPMEAVQLKALLRSHLPEGLRLPLIDSAAIHRRRWQESFDERQLRLAAMTAAMARGLNSFKSVADAWVFSLMSLPENLSRFDFDVNDVQAKRLAVIDEVAPSYHEWIVRQHESDYFQSAELVLAGDISDESIFLTAVRSSNSDSISISGVNRVIETRVRLPIPQDEREREDRRNHLAGESAERRLVSASVKNLLSADDRDRRWQEVFDIWEIVRDLNQKSELDALPRDCPATKRELAEWLHVAKKFGDGLGFDVLEVGGTVNQVWLSEVKSATAGRLHLSENERRKALYYESHCKGLWRLKMWLGNGQWADDQPTRSFLDAFNSIETATRGLVGEAEGWVFGFNVGSSPNTP